ncbi:MAG: 5-formyltetrahydrofolate cyclo-ligase [Tannerellaceae bacterium]|nr:5-formyltetrahydrofolate cyclo-ligase [Tannerellaceae bacterium]
MNIQALKKQLRKEVISKKKDFSPESLFSYSANILEQLEKEDVFINASTIAFYYALPDEVQTLPCIEKWYKKKLILLPVIRENEMHFHSYQGKEWLQTGTLGIAEPITEITEQKYTIDLAIIPGIAFDSHLNRMGRGKGFYDRFLSEKTMTKIGICFDFQLYETIPCEPTDIKMDKIITEKRIIE